MIRSQPWATKLLLALHVDVVDDIQYGETWSGFG